MLDALSRSYRLQTFHSGLCVLDSSSYRLKTINCHAQRIDLQHLFSPDLNVFHGPNVQIVIAEAKRHL